MIFWLTLRVPTLHLAWAKRALPCLWEDGLKKKDSQPAIDQIKHLIGIELPEGDLSFLKRKTGSLLRSNTMPVKPKSKS